MAARAASAAAAASAGMWRAAARSPVRSAIAAAAGAAAVGTAAVQAQASAPRAARASGDGVHPTPLAWGHTGWLSGYDHAALRRGWMVYQEVCAACHSVEQLHWRELVGVVMDEDEAKELAAENDYPDEPDSEGEINDRPGKLADPLPKPYANEQAARAGNNGALPPDLSLITKAREAGPDHVFAVLTGYRDPPAGIQLREGLHYNIYFPGGAIGMAQGLFDDMVEYEDGTPASVSQMAKDVSVFLSWAAEPEADQRKKMGLKAVIMLLLLSGPSLFWRRQKWAVLKTRAISFTKVKPARATRV